MSEKKKLSHSGTSQTEKLDGGKLERLGPYAPSIKENRLNWEFRL